VQATILELGAQFRRRTLSPVEVTRDCLARLERFNPALNAFITITADSALAQAREAEAEIHRGDWRGPLHGIPLGLKDLIDTAGVRTTAASALFADRIPQADAEVVQRLKRAGAVLLGKQNLHEFAYGGSSMISYSGEAHNPWDPGHLAGGSSGGSAAAVAVSIGFGAIGTDTAGSVREPAALCGVVGLKPTYGRVSARGVIPLSPSLDHVGPIGRTVADVAALLQVIAGFDPHDPTSANVPVEDYLAAIQENATPPRIGIPRAFFFDDLDPEVASAVDQAILVLSTLAREVRDVSLSVPTDRSLQAAESYAYHAQFLADSSHLYQPETLRRIRSGENVTAREVEKGRRELEQARRDIQKIFEEVDVLVTPTTPVAAPPMAPLRQSPDLLRPCEILLLRNTRPANVWGLPAISVPCGFTHTGLPIGLQIIGPPWAEAAALRLAHAYEQATVWHKRRPAMCAGQN